MGSSETMFNVKLHESRFKTFKRVQGQDAAFSEDVSDGLLGVRSVCPLAV